MPIIDNDQARGMWSTIGVPTHHVDLNILTLNKSIYRQAVEGWKKNGWVSVRCDFNLMNTCRRYGLHVIWDGIYFESLEGTGVKDIAVIEVHINDHMEDFCFEGRSSRSQSMTTCILYNLFHVSIASNHLAHCQH